MPTIMQEQRIEVINPEAVKPEQTTMLNRLMAIAQEEAAKIAETGRYCRRFARRQWRKELGDTFRFRGKYFKGGGYVHSFRTWANTQGLTESQTFDRMAI